MDTVRLFENIAYTGTLPCASVTGITNNSRKVHAGSIFVCSVGRTSDSHAYAADALAAGAVLIVSERPLGLENEVTVANGRIAYAQLCAAFFEHPADKLRLVAVTGTNGKTTVTSVIREILEDSGHRCGLIGTSHVLIGERELPAKFTTPEPWDLQALFARMVAGGCECAVMEASSQALDQLRLYGLHFECGVFTNLSQDHLDYHGTMENYFAAKATLFDACDTILYNKDDSWACRLETLYPDKKKVSFSYQDDTADYTAHSVVLGVGGVRFALVGRNSIQRVSFPMPGAFSVYNAMAAALAGMCMGVPAEAVSKALQNSAGVCGRCEVLYHGKFTVICDYAHTADSIEKILSSLRPFAEGRMVALFGCAGERDTTKRPAMAQAVIRNADVIMITSDNPRGDDPMQIISQIEPIICDSGKPYFVEPERRAAVLKILGELRSGDVLVLCGKGHEDYQAIDGMSVYLDEHRIVHDWLKEKGMLGEE